MTGNEWLIRDARNNPDGALLWWGPNRAGYTTDLDAAGRYSEDEARKQAVSRVTDHSVPLSRALAAAVTATTVPATLATVDSMRTDPRQG